MDIQKLLDQVKKLQETLGILNKETTELASITRDVVSSHAMEASLDPFIMLLTIFILACFVGYYVVWKVTPALHSPLMAVTNAISSVIVVGALIGAGASSISMGFGALDTILAAINIFGGFIVTQRMLAMFSKK